MDERIAEFSLSSSIVGIASPTQLFFPPKAAYTAPYVNNNYKDALSPVLTPWYEVGDVQVPQCNHGRPVLALTHLMAFNSSVSRAKLL